MRPGVRAWVDKAESDYRVAVRESRVRKLPSPDAVCFHAQQCVEKYLKGAIRESGAAPPRSNDLTLLWSCLTGSSITTRPLPALGQLTVGAVEYRYPGRAATAAQALRAVRLMIEVRGRCRAFLGLPIR